MQLTSVTIDQSVARKEFGKSARPEKFLAFSGSTIDWLSFVTTTSQKQEIADDNVHSTKPGL
jgi:hypothetical protein